MLGVVDPKVVTELRAALIAAGVTQYRLRAEAGLSADTARILLGLKPGVPSLASADAALRLIGRRLTHRKATPKTD